MNTTTRFAGSSRGTTTPKWAILIFVIIVGIVAAVRPLGHLTTVAFRDASLLGFTDASVSAKSAIQGADGESGLAAIESVLAAVPDFLSSKALLTTALSSLAVAITAAWIMLRKRSSRGSATPRPLATERPKPACHRDVEKRQKIARCLYNHTDTLLKGDIEVRHLMTASRCTVERNATVERARDIMEKQELDYLLVCDPNGKLLGLVSHFYLRRSSAKTVVHAMVPNPLFVAPNAMLSPTVTQMLNEGVSCVAVVEQERAIGMVTTKDIQLTFQAALQILAKVTSESRGAEPQPV